MFWLNTSFCDERGEQPAGEPAVARLLTDQGGSGADAQLVELHRGGAVAEATDRARGHPHRVDTLEPLGRPADRPHDLVEIDRFEAAVTLLHPHRAGEPQRRLVANLASSCSWRSGRSMMVMLSPRPFAFARIPRKMWAADRSATLDLVWGRGTNYITVTTTMQELRRESTATSGNAASAAPARLQISLCMWTIGTGTPPVSSVLLPTTVKPDAS